MKQFLRSARHLIGAAAFGAIGLGQVQAKPWDKDDVIEYSQKKGYVLLK